MQDEARWERATPVALFSSSFGPRSSSSAHDLPARSRSGFASAKAGRAWRPAVSEDHERHWSGALPAHRLLQSDAVPADPPLVALLPRALDRLGRVLGR